MPFFKVTLVFQRHFLTWSLMECLNSDFKESAHGRWAGVAAPSAGHPEVCGGSRGASLQLWRARRAPWEPMSGKHLALGCSTARASRSIPCRRFCAGRWVLEAPPTFLLGPPSPRSRRFAGAELLRLSVQTSKLTSLQFGGASCPASAPWVLVVSVCAGDTAAGQAAWPWCREP